MKYPYMQLFAGDYLSDPKLSLCSSSTRGIWMDLLCVMHMNDRCGVITGTREQLARLGRCSTVEVSIAIDELQTTETADVMIRNDAVTLICRRMKRDADARKLNKLRVQKYREHADVTDTETGKSLLVYGSGNSPSVVKGESEGKESPPSGKVKPETLARVALHFLNEKAGRAFRETDANLSPIVARLESVKLDIEGVKQMIGRQVELWKGDAEMDEYLCPATLFRKSNFDKYYDNRHLPVMALKKPGADNPRNSGIGGDQAKRTAAVVARVAAMQKQNEQPKN